MSAADYVRFTRGPLAGILGHVEAVEPSGARVRILGAAPAPWRALDVVTADPDGLRVVPVVAVCSWSLPGCERPKAQADPDACLSDGICAPCRRSAFGR